ncbi:MAG: hypothetical protein ACFCVD_23840 [Nodosilinea sp.]
MGAVDGLMGAVEGKVSLALLGLLLAGGTLTLRWWQIQRATSTQVDRSIVLYLPDYPASQISPLRAEPKRPED